jgi:formylglycine-generating enzyme required for sulfatase activity
MKRIGFLTLLGLGAFLTVFFIARQGEQVGTSPSAAAPAPTPAGMVWIPPGTFTMGTDSDAGWPDEKPVHRVRVDGFWMDVTEVTNAQFLEFITATGHVTTAEKAPTADRRNAQRSLRY